MLDVAKKCQNFKALNEFIKIKVDEEHKNLENYITYKRLQNFNWMCFSYSSVFQRKKNGRSTIDIISILYHKNQM